MSPTMDAVLRATSLLLLGLLCSAPPPTSSYRVHIPPHDQVARVARFVAHRCDWASMATVSTHKPVVGQPFSNVFSVSDGPVCSGTGVPYMYLTHMEISVQDLQVNPQASMSMSLAQTHYCREQGFDPQSPLCAHIILSGSVMEVNGTEAEFAKKALFSRHPEMMDWPSDHGWFFAKFNITQVWVLDYFGGVKTVTPEEYFNATLLTKHH
ncbi:protein CREG1 [Takifugu flavidus]|uniref:Protein CREG1 n=1 Tax=Takifugu flavidus TaxID=433684 RepID=A0A5C6NAL1_9TELE|nr:protein CREG1 [Takifugu flavidus]TWW63868.1 Protein CREG1 [Takifugu flavidus]